MQLPVWTVDAFTDQPFRCLCLNFVMKYQLGSCVIYISLIPIQVSTFEHTYQWHSTVAFIDSQKLITFSSNSHRPISSSNWCSGNPAAVSLLEQDIPDHLKQVTLLNIFQDDILGGLKPVKYDIHSDQKKWKMTFLTDKIRKAICWCLSACQ